MDDEPAVREALTGSLEFEGYRVAEAADGVAALQSVARERPDLVLLDVLMPRMDGLPAAAGARRKTGVDGMPRLVHTVRGVGYVLRTAQSP